jgi:hypothetical protein
MYGHNGPNIRHTKVKAKTRGEMTTDAMGLQQSLERKLKNSSRIYQSYIPFGDLIKENGEIDFHIYQSYH